MLEGRNITNKCSIKSFRETVKQIIFDNDYCDGGNEIGFNQDIPISMIKYVKIPSDEVSELPKYVVNMFQSLGIKLIVS